MKKHWKYLKYVIRHKWYVLLAGLQLRVWWHQLLLHDWTKFTPVEWFAYVNHFYNRNAAIKGSFERAWNHHIRWNPHHWQYWVLNRDDGRKPEAVEMPERFVREMVADWIGAGRAQGNDDLSEWFYDRYETIILHPKTRELVVSLVNAYEDGKTKG